MHFTNDLASLRGQNFHGAAVTIGNFDGLHLGHRRLLAVLNERPGPRVVVTFSPHPVQVLHPDRGLRRLFPRADLIEHLPALGVDLLVELPFTRDFASLTATRFLDDCVGAPFAPRSIVAGYDFAFGKSRAGSLDGLTEWAAARGADVTVVPPLTADGAVVSSRRLRELVGAGEVAAARALLGRPFYLRGVVGRGAGRGATIGFPTLNQIVENETLPATGVYVTRARANGVAHAAVTNVGFTPTFGSEAQLKVETHVLDADLAWRDRVIDVDFLARLRPEMKFDGAPSLKLQIARDIAAARALLTAESGDSVPRSP